jgi:hypothetical protein
MLGPGGTDSQECDIYTVTQTLIPARPPFIVKQLLLLSHARAPYSFMSSGVRLTGGSEQTLSFLAPLMNLSFAFLPTNPKF